MWLKVKLSVKAPGVQGDEGLKALRYSVVGCKIGECSQKKKKEPSAGRCSGSYDMAIGYSPGTEVPYANF